MEREEMDSWVCKRMESVMSDGLRGAQQGETLKTILPDPREP